MLPREVCRGSSHPRRGEGARKERVCGVVGGLKERYVECSNELIDSSGGFRFVAMPGIRGAEVGLRDEREGKKTIVWEK